MVDSNYSYLSSSKECLPIRVLYWQSSKLFALGSIEVLKVKMVRNSMSLFCFLSGYFGLSSFLSSQ